MALEVELKLTLSPHHIESLKLQPLFQSDRVTALGSQTLKNTYYDTPDHLLTQHKVALRIRQKGEQLIQTLKTQGTSEAGLHSRNEWEWNIHSQTLDYSLLQQAQWPPALSTPEVQANICESFSTDFTRTLWILDTLDTQGQPLKAEIALDQGHVSYQQQQSPICELELELLEGDAHALISIAIELARSVPLYICDVSKAHRGYRLQNPQGFEVARPASTTSANTPLEEIFVQLLAQELALWPRYFEAWQFNRDWQHITSALEALRNIDALYESFSDIIPAEPDGEISRLLIKLIRQLRDIDSWRRTAELTGHPSALWHQKQAQRAASRIDVLLQTADPGILALLMSDQLVQRTWRQRWTSQHQTLAQAPLSDIE